MAFYGSLLKVSAILLILFFGGNFIWDSLLEWKYGESTQEANKRFEDFKEKAKKCKW